MLTLVALAGCGPTDDARVELHGRATAGPVCPVISDPPDPDCEDRPVSGAVIIARDDSGTEVERTTTDSDGTFVLRLPAGTYWLEGAPFTGLLGTPPGVSVTIEAGSEPEPVELSYDTGIR